MIYRFTSVRGQFWLTEYDIQQDVDGFDSKINANTTELVWHHTTSTSLHCSWLSSLVALKRDGVVAGVEAGQPWYQQGR